MKAFSALLSSLMSGEPKYTLQRPDSFIIMEQFTHDGFDYIRTTSAYYEKPVYKNLWRKLSKHKYEYTRSFYHTAFNRSQAKGLLKYTQLEFVL